MKKTLLIICALMTTLSSQAREQKNFDADWRFVLADSAQMSAPDYDDSSWRQLNVPHDWSIEGDFSASNPAGAGGGALPGGIGWYRKHFVIDRKVPNDARFFIQFDGVYMNSTVYINGHELGTRPYGFSSFEYDITPYLNLKGSNVLAVRVDNSQQPNCRWYSGSGIYRHVYLLQTASTHIAQWGVFVKPRLSDDGRTATFCIQTEVAGRTANTTVTHILKDAEGHEVGRTNDSLIVIEHPQLWSTTNPYIYTVRSEVRVGKRIVDVCETNAGVRTLVFDPKTGFSLNSVPMKINGVCQHHDLGLFGAAIQEDALYRQLKMLRDMGCNSIRCSHNPPSPELLNMCDTMGLLVMDEAFDMWHRKKTQYDYSRFFDKWHERDLSDLVRRDRNHPCIIMWSTGNEVLEQWSGGDESDELTIEEANMVLNFGHDASQLSHSSEKSVNTLLAEHLAGIIRNLDGTRPVIAGCNEPDPKNHLFKGNGVDIIGYNYHNSNIADVPKNFPDRPFMLSESVSALMTRGFYVNPSDSDIVAPEVWWKPYTDPSNMCSAYDNSRAPWANHHEETWDIVKHNDFVMGQYIWTGWDYIGEPTPYGYPARSSYFGIIDLAGFPKDIYYMYQSEWTQKPVLHLFPHWNWIEGQTIDMWCYYNNADEVELFVNGRSQGIRRKGEHDYHVMWRVTFEPGEVRVVARKDGRLVGEQTIRTASAPDHIALHPVRYGNTSFVEVAVLDRDGNLCPRADNQIFFETTGNMEILGVDNGCQTSSERFKDNKRKAFFGKCLVVVKGSGTLTAKGYDVKSASVTF